MAQVKLCETPSCNKEAKFKCPTCLKLDIEASSFCSQECFKQNWDDHKKLHKKARDDVQTQEKTTTAYNPWPGFIFTGKLRPFPQSKQRQVPDKIQRPDYADHAEGLPLSERAIKGTTSIEVLSDEDQEELRASCKLAREVLDEAAKAVGVGVTCDEIDRIVHEASIDRNCYPSPLNYYNFPKSCCTSVNEVICHGIPDMRPLADGDIVNLDITTYFHGFHGDVNETVFVGKVDEQARKLVKVTYESLAKAIEIVKPGVKYRDVGDVIQKHVQAHGLSVVRSYCGHGIHRLFHTTPSIPHYSKNKAIGIMKAGHSFTIEPMICEGTWRDVTWPDDWTSVTQDGKRSAQFEHTLLVTEHGCDILTQRATGQPWFMDNFG